MSSRFLPRHAQRPLLFLVSLAEGTAWAANGTTTVPYLDGQRSVLAERLGPPVADARGRSLSKVRLGYGDRSFEASIDGTAIVRLDPGGEDVLAREGFRIVEPLMPSIGLFLVDDMSGGDGLVVASRLAAKEARAGGVRGAVPNLYVKLAPHGMPFVPDDPRFSGQWYFDDKRTRMSEAWGITTGDAATTVVVIDSGCDMTHPDLVDKMDPGLDVVDGDDDPSYDPAFQGGEHGTACAGIVAAKTNNAIGIAGACPECRIRCVRMLTDVAIPLAAHVKAFDFVLQTGAAVASNSWGFAEPTPVPQLLRDAIDNVFDNGRGGKGAIVMFAAGNEDREIGADELNAVRGVTAIGAVTQLYDKTSFTNYGDSVDLVAPVGTLTTDIAGAGGMDPTDYTNNFGGTSSACPVAAGVAALLASAMPEKTSAEIVDLMVQTALPAPYALPDANGHDPVFGFGIVSPVDALKKGLGIVDEPPPPAPDPPIDPAEAASCACRAGAPAGGPSSGLAGLFYGVGLAGLALLRRARYVRR